MLFGKAVGVPVVCNQGLNETVSEEFVKSPAFRHAPVRELTSLTVIIAFPTGPADLSVSGDL